MKMSNKEIYNLTICLMEAFQEQPNQILPMKLNYYIKKNLYNLKTIASHIELCRNELLQKYGEKQKDGCYIIQIENQDIFTKEINDLMNIEEEINIHFININDFDNSLALTNAQMDAIMFMLVEE